MREDEGSAELAERVPGDAYHSYLAKCIKTTTPRNIELTELIYDSLRAQRGHILLALGRTRVQRQDSSPAKAFTLQSGGGRVCHPT